MKETIKKQIESNIEFGNIKQARQCIEEYRKEYPADRDIAFYEIIIKLSENDLDMAQNIAEQCVRKFPTSYEAYYYQGSVYQAKGMVQEALQSYKTAIFLHSWLKKEKNDITNDAAAQIAVLEQEFNDIVEDYINNSDLQNLQKTSPFFLREETFYGKKVRAPRNSSVLIVGQEYWVTDDDLRYIGIYRAPIQEFVGEENLSLIRTQAEFLKFCEHGLGTSISGDAEEYLVPVASEKAANIYKFSENGEHSGTIVQCDPRHFNYYRVKNKTNIVSKERAYYGYPIPLEHKQGRKKLVLSFFVDGLAQEVIGGADFKRLMPNTYRFFSEGIICTQAFSGAEWTFPSLATYESGLSTFHHMMFHSTIDGELPKNVPTLSEYLKRKGYYTCKMDGEWRSIYSYGFARGIDRYVYQIQPMGGRAEQEIINVIEHIETFKETDQYLWMTVGDLHDIADELDLSTAVQSKLTLDEREYEPMGETSVKQNYSKKKKQMYEKTIKYLDVLFGVLFSYIENNYSDDEILISLFSDHGQGYLVPPEKHFLSKERTKVAFMFRGGNVKKGIVDEIISTADYLPIMCRLTDTEPDDVKIDGSLPRAFGGETEREYAITESLHPGDMYSAVANAKEYEIYFSNTEKTDDEGRFKLGDYTVCGFYKDGRKIEDKNLLERFEKIFLNRIAEHIIYE